MMRLLIGSFGLAALAALFPQQPAARVPFTQRPALVDRGTCMKPQEWSVRVRARDTVRTGAELRLEVTIGGGPAGGNFRVTLRAPEGALALAQTSWDETLAPGQAVVRTVTATCNATAPIPVVAKCVRTDPGFEHVLPAQHALSLLSLQPGALSPASLGWDPGTGRATNVPGMQNVTLRSGERILLIPAR